MVGAKHSLDGLPYRKVCKYRRQRPEGFEISQLSANRRGRL